MPNQQGPPGRSAADYSLGTAIAPWWGPHGIPLDESRFWQIGPLRLWTLHRQFQWQLVWEHDSNWLKPDIHVNIPENERRPDPNRDAHRVHCVYQESVHELAFSPNLADRPLVTKLEHPLRVLPGESASLYVCSPLWLRVETVQKTGLPQKQLIEIPIFRLSDTWFGPADREGELAYASKVPVYLALREVPLRLHCAITAVMVRNLGSDSLVVDRIKLPMPQLSLFYSRKSGFWTDTVILERDQGSELATIRSEHEPPAEAAPHQFISPPRDGAMQERSVVRAFSGLFR